MIAAVWGVSGCGAPRDAAPVADLVLTGGTVATMDPARPRAEAIAVTGHTIAAVGSRDEIQTWVGDATQVIDLEGRFVIPGFIEGHGHFLSLGRSRTILDLTRADSWDEIVSQVAAAAREAPAGAWIFGRGWHQEKWSVQPAQVVDGVPLHAVLSAASPDHPVQLTHASGHASIANAKAMALAGITRASADPPGGTIVRDDAGEPTGLLRETAQGLLQPAIEATEAALSDADREARRRLWARLAGEVALSHGVTSFQDAGSSFEEIDLFRAMAAAGDLPVRLYVMIRRESNEALEDRIATYRILPQGNDFLAVRSIKKVIDGALGSHGAWLIEPYEDLPDSTGLNLESMESLAHTARIAMEHGFQVNTHAIGDRGNREVLDVYERTFRDHPDRKDPRWRIEHAQHLHPDDIPRFAGLGVIASVQAIHCTSDGPWVPKRIGEARAASGAYVWRALIDSGAVVINGTDVPVEPIDPIANVHAAVTREMPDGEAFHADQRMTPEEALRSATRDAAWAAFEDHLKGAIVPGLLADLTVLSQDLLAIDPAEIPLTRVEMTIVGGEIRYERHPQRGTEDAAAR